MIYTIECLCERYDTVLAKVSYTKYIDSLKAYDRWIDWVFQDITMCYKNLIHCNNIDLARMVIVSKETVKMIDKIH